MSLSFPLEHFLAEMEYPATKDDLLREAARDGLDADDRRLLETLDDHGYSARWEVLSELRTATARELTTI
ncbi:DUF2795 domain-containing protein [Microbacterium sp. YJN-G]|uniref:DUF2795 domain-containing protein n=1 Tax=Microbacterium sp. YJN-G TaxID=2763257 RepID=UPI001878995E|nr:DUF2795 domain-containing protein [Microbacterium sp. YJN-G]